jgi:hypothetical protein
MKTGRPAKYTDPAEMQKKIDEYFAECPDTRVIYPVAGQPQTVPDPTITGLVLHLGFCDRAAFYDYCDKPEFRNTLKKARSRVEKIYESLLKGGSCTGAIFWLKNHGWRDTQDINTTSNEKVVVIVKSGNPVKVAGSRVDIKRKAQNG